MFNKWFVKDKNAETINETTNETTNPSLTSEIKTEYVPTPDAEIVQENKDVTPEPQNIPLTYKELKALKRSRYEDKIMLNPLFKKAYVIQNIKTGQVAEVRAASSLHACNIIGWKPRRVRVISEKVIEVKEEEAAQTSTLSPEIQSSEIKTTV